MKFRREFAGLLRAHDLFFSCRRNHACMIHPAGTKIEKGAFLLKTKWAYTGLLSLSLAAALAGQMAAGAQTGQGSGNQKAIPVASEHHHRLSFQNQYVRVFEVRLAPHESTLLHQHDNDYVYISIGDGQISATVPGQAEMHVKLAHREARFVRGGFAHVVRNDGDQEFHVTDVDLVQPQGKVRNLCLQVIAGEPLACPEAQDSAAKDAAYTERPEFETGRTRVVLIRVQPHREVLLSDGEWDQLLVSVEESVLAPAIGKGPERLLHPGDFAWLGRGGLARVLKNNGGKEAWFYRIEMHPATPGEAATGPIVGAPLAPKKP